LTPAKAAFGKITAACNDHVPTAANDGGEMKLSVFNQKGGVGKTSIACNLAACFAKQGKRTIVVDLDAQGNASHYLGFDYRDGNDKTMSDYFQSTLGINLFSAGISEFVRSTAIRNLYVLPSDLRLGELQPKLEGRYKIFKLRDAIDSLMSHDKFDHVVFDCPPAMNFYSMSALMASDKVVIPFDCDAFAISGLREVMRSIADVRDDHNPRLEIAGVIVNQFIANAKQSKAALDQVKSLGLNIFEPYITTSVAMRESHDERLPLVGCKPKHKLTESFAEISRLLSV
jgi:chromosome partitioning protein